MTPATELATIPLATGASIEDPTSPAGKVWAGTISTVSQQDGFQRAHWGREVENPSVLQFFVGKRIYLLGPNPAQSNPTQLLSPVSKQTKYLGYDWDSLEHHKKFIASPIYGPFCAHLATIVDGAVAMHHANFSPHPPSAALGPAAPVTEVLTCYFESEGGSNKADGFEGRFDGLIRSISDSGAEGFKGAAGGWMVDEVEYKGEKRKAFVGLVGWESVGAHMAFRETQAFRDNIPLLRQESLGMELHHTKFDQS